MILLAFRPARASPTRRTILDAIAESPGCTKAELCRATGLSWGVVSHHIRHCDRLGEVRLLRTDRKVFLYLASVHTDQMALMRLLRNDVVQQLVGAVQEQPGTGIRALSLRLDLSRKVVRRHLADLVDAGVVERSGDYRPKFRVLQQAPDAPPAQRGPRLELPQRPG